LQNNSELVSEGKLTAAGVSQLKSSMPHVDFSEFEKDPDLNKIPDLFQVKSIVNYVEGKVNS